jgi:outer membrane protein assembly factor BamA
VLVLRAATEFIAPFGSAPVPFTELPTLGGPDDLRGFRNQLFHGRSSFIASAEYRFPVWIWMDFVLFADYGGVFGQWYQGFGARQLQPDLGGGLLLFGRNRFFLRVQVAYGWGEGWRISLATRSWPWP